MYSDVHEGGCLCGAIRYKVTGKSLHVSNCHCSMCRRHSGAAYMTYVAYPKLAYSVQGEQANYRSSSSVVRGYCKDCGSPLTFVHDDNPEIIWLTIGSFDEPDDLKPREHIYVSNKISWVSLDDGLPQWLDAGN